MKQRLLLIALLSCLTAHASFPTEGTIRSVVILVEFSDVYFTTPSPNEAFTRLLNEAGYAENGGTGSARDYFIQNSGGIFTPDFDVYGPYRLPKNVAYYGGNEDNSDRNPEGMIIDACTAAQNDGVDFSLYDMDNDGVIDNVFVYYAGYNEAEGGGPNTIWPHRFYIKDRPVYGGKQLYDYACTSELRMSSNGRKEGLMCGIGTFCHEFSHVLGLPDLYNTRSSETYTVGKWDIMCSGNYNNEGRTPPAYSSFERFMTGWLKPEQLQQAGDYLLPPLNTAGQSYLLCPTTHSLDPSNPEPAEFWMLENRQHTGWDTPGEALPGTGMLIAHITHNGVNWLRNTYNNNTPLGYDICEAYNRYPHSSTGSDTYPGTMNVTEFIPEQNNGLRLYELELANIRQNEDGTISFHFGEESDRGFHFSPRELPTLHTAVDGLQRTYETGLLHITGNSIADSVVYIVCTPNLFEVSTDSIVWHTDTLWLHGAVNDSTFIQNVYLRYRGTQTCQTKNGMLRISTADRQQAGQTLLSGYASRPVKIGPVTGLAARDVTPYSFIANWEAQEDAELYYLTVYHLKEGESAQQQGFESFDSEENIRAAQWSSNFVHLTNNEHAEGNYALLFSETGDYVESELYPIGVSKLSFWMSHTYTGTDSNTGGELELRAQIGDTWQVIDTIRMRAMSRAQTRNYTFTAEQNFRRFRLTYRHQDGLGGITADQWIATLPQTVEYILRRSETTDNQRLIDSLQPSNHYYYLLSCYEDKGCEPHTSQVGTPIHVATIAGTTEERQFTIIHEGDHATAYFKQAAEQDSRLLVYSPSGNLEMDIPVPAGSTHAVIPTDLLPSGSIYLVKLSSDGSLRRKEHWAKFLN